MSSSNTDLRESSPTKTHRHKELSKRLSVFDLDHTLFRGNSSYHFGRHLYHRGHLSTVQVAWALSCYLCHKAFGMSLFTLHRTIFPLFRGRPQAELASEVSSFLDINLDALLFPPALTRLRQAQAAAERTLILSNSPSFLVEEIGWRLGVDESLGTVYGIDQSDRLCSVEQSFEGEQKAEYVRQAAGRWGTPMSNITAYSDSHLDLPLLEMVGHPIAVAPDVKLRKLALARQWTVME